jgi:hypothetical protein
MKFLGKIAASLADIKARLNEVLAKREGRKASAVPMTRRQVRRSMESVYPRLKSGRQWTRYRKNLKRTTGINLLKLGA